VRSVKFQSLATALIIAVAAPLSVATTISGFDDLDGSGNQAIPNGYARLNWDNFSNYDAKNDPAAHLNSSGYDSSFVSAITRPLMTFCSVTQSRKSEVKSQTKNVQADLAQN